MSNTADESAERKRYEPPLADASFLLTMFIALSWPPAARHRDEDAYKTRLQTAHFKKLRATTDSMVKSRKLIDTVPISLATKAK